jgi:hypothetical protein
LNASSLLVNLRVCNACKSENKNGSQQGVKLVHLENANSDCEPTKLEIEHLVAGDFAGSATKAQLAQFSLDAVARFIDAVLTRELET